MPPVAVAVVETEDTGETLDDAVTLNGAVTVKGSLPDAQEIVAPDIS